MEWRILAQRAMNARSIIMREKFPHDPAQVCLSKYDHVVEDIPAGSCRPAFDVSILPRRTDSNGLIADTHRA
jgi:hypothetical protein